MDFNLKKEGDIQPHAVVALQETSTTSLPTNNDPVSRAKELLTLHHSMSKGLNFDHTKELVLECVDEILEHWLPDGEYRGRHYVAYNPTRNDNNLGSFTINTETGQWADYATVDKGGDLISLVAYLEGGISQTDSAVKILEFIAGLKSDDSAATPRRNTRRKAKPKSEYTAIVPIPTEAIGRPVFFGTDLGHPSATWEYRNAVGQVVCYVNRFETKPRKTILPQTYCRDATGHCQWRNMAPPTPRPPYGLDRLAKEPEAPVLFAEGEKSADAAQRLFPTFVAVTSMNGAQSPEKTDFTPFAGRKVYIAPDNDNAGIAYKDTLIKLLRSAGAEVVATMRLEALAKNGVTLMDGYDLADAEVDGWTADAFAKLEASLWEPVSPDEPIPATNPSAVQTRQQDAPASQPKKKKPLDFVNEFAIQNYGGNIASCNNQILAYRNGYWDSLNPDVDVKKPILNAMDDSASASKVNGVFELLKIQYASRPEKFEHTSGLICLNNGTLDPVSGKLLPHSIEHFLTNKVDIDYDVDSQCCLWLQTLDEIFSPDSDRVEKIQLLQEYIGYCLIPDTRMHKFLWMVGSGGNGKSLILELITALIGKVNISYAPIERLQEKFTRAELQGKLVNISSEMAAQATVSDGYLKQITAGDMIEAERKNERPFSFKPYSRLIGATNVLPRLLDHSDGFFRRAIVLRFNRQFTEAEKDNQRKAKLMAELPGILNWAVTGLQNLLRRGSFVIPSSSKTEVAQYRVNSDPVRQFAEEFLTATNDKDRWVASGALYDRYKAWSGENGYKTLASNQFAERLSGVGIDKERRSDGRYWKAEYNDSPFRHLPPVPPTLPPVASKYDV